MIESTAQGSGFPVKAAIVLVLLLTILPLVLFILVQFAPPSESASSTGTTVESASARSTAAERLAQRTETRAARQETRTAHASSVPHGMAPDPAPAEFDPPPADDISIVGVGAVVPNAPRGKQATPYPPGEVPGDSGVLVQYAGSPDDMIGAPPPPPPAPEDDLWGGRPATPIPPENMRGIGGVRRIDPNDPFFQQDIPNPFDR
jgi:hypothetical protein